METLDELRTEIRDAMQTRAEAEARHAFGDRIIDFATTNATVELPEVMVTNEIEIMRDELRRGSPSSGSAWTSTWRWRSRRPRSSSPSFASRRPVG